MRNTTKMMCSSQRQIPLKGFNVFWIIAASAITVTLWSGSIVSVYGAPAKLDSNVTPFPLELQTPLFTDAVAAANGDNDNTFDTSKPSAIDSYGNPIESLQPINTPDGRKVVSAQGLQFEIPNYASGITEIKKPSDDLLPPFVDDEEELLNVKSVRDDSNNNNSDNDNDTIDHMVNVAADNNKKDNNDDYNQTSPKILSDTIYKLQDNNNENNNNNDDDDDDDYISQIQLHNKEQQHNHNHQHHLHQHQYYGSSLKTTNAPESFTVVTTASTIDYTNNNKHSLEKLPISIIPSPILTTSADNVIQPHLNLLKRSQAHGSPPHIHTETSTWPTPFSFAFPISISSHIAPLSSGNFNYPDVPTDISVINRIAAKYQKPFPTLDPIAIAVPNVSNNEQQQLQQATSAIGAGAASATVSGQSSAFTTVDIENAELTEHHTQQLQQESEHAPNVIDINPNEIPAYLLDLNDPDIGGPVDWSPADDTTGLKVIAWDLLPPNANDNEPAIITKENAAAKRVIGIEDPKTHNIKVSLTSGQVTNSEIQPGRVSIVDLKQSGSHPGFTSVNALEDRHANVISSTSPNIAHDQIHFSLDRGSHTTETTTKSAVPKNRGTTYYTSPTPRSTTTRAPRPATTTTTTTTTTPRPSTTTTRRTTSARTTTRTTRAPTTTTARPTPLTTTTSEPLDPSEIYQLEAGDSYTLPSWLADIDDPDLDAAVTFIVPDDLNEYNHTVERDLLPPFEPFVDLNSINLPSPLETSSNPSVKTTTTIKQRPSMTTTTRRTTTYVTSTTTAAPATSRPQWVRADPPIAATTTPKSTSSISNRFTSNHIVHTPPPLHSQTASVNTHTNTNSKTSTQASIPSTFTTTSTTTKPIHHQQSFNVFNHNIPTTATNVDLISENNDSKEAAAVKPKLTNPFLPSRGAFSQQASRPTVLLTTTTTTTTTTPATPSFEPNPFDSATVPPWLADFDYADVGPGVPYTFDPSNPEADVSNDLLPPSNIAPQETDTSNKPVFVTSSPSSFSSIQTTQSFTQHQPNSFASSSTSSTSASSATSSISPFPSKVTIPIPSIQSNQNQNPNEAVTLPPVVFIPPMAIAEDTNNDDGDLNDNTNADDYNAKKEPSSTSFNKNFPAPFEPTTAAEQDASFPTAGIGAGTAIGVSASGIPTKTTFTKSDDGKVITNNVLLQGGVAGQPASKPFGLDTNLITQQKDFQATHTNQFFSSSATGFSGTSTASGAFGGVASFSKTQTSTPTGFSSFSTAPQTTSTFGNSASFGKGGVAATGATAIGVTGGPGKYTGGFGGAPGVLGGGKVGYAVQADGSIRDPDHTFRPPIAANAASAAATTAAVTFAPVPVPAPTKSIASAFTVGGSSFSNRVGVAATASSSSNNAFKYSGHFGGPPGILVPYDNVKGGK